MPENIKRERMDVEPIHDGHNYTIPDTKNSNVIKVDNSRDLQVEQWSSETINVLHIIQLYMPTGIRFDNLVKDFDKKLSVKTFYETLLLVNSGYVWMGQNRPFGRIDIQAGKKLL